VQQNSANPTRTGPNRYRIIEHFGLSDGTYTDLSSYRYFIFCYCSYTWAVQFIRRMLHLNISFICWFRVIRVLFCVFWSLHSSRRWWRRIQGVRIYHNGWCTDILGGLFWSCL